MTPETMQEFSRLELYAKIQQAPPVKFKDLEAVVSSRLVRDQVKFQYRTDFLRITSETVLVPITIQIPTRQLSFQQKNGVESASVNLFCRVTSLSGRIVNTFEDTVRRDVPSSLAAAIASDSFDLSEGHPAQPRTLPPGHRLEGHNNGNVGVVNTRLAVPRFEDDSLSSSTLILADEIKRVSSHDIGLGQFVLGDVKVRPRIDSSFTASDEMGVFLQVYNLKVDDKTHKADATVQYRVTMDKENDPVLKYDLGRRQTAAAWRRDDAGEHHHSRLVEARQVQAGSRCHRQSDQENNHSGYGIYRPANRFASATGEVSFMNLRTIRSMGLGIILCLSWCVLPLAVMAAQASGKITGLVVDSTGTPQMGATVIISSGQLLNSMAFPASDERSRPIFQREPAGRHLFR